MYNFYILCVLLLGLNTVNCVDPKVSITESDPSVVYDNIMYATRGKDITMSCYVENLQPGTFVRWQRNYVDHEGRDQTEPISQDQGVVDNTRYGIEKPTMFTWRLRVRSIPLSYEGIYMCFVQVVLQIKTYEERVVRVFVPPTLILAQTSSDVSAKEGDIIDLVCNATGVPTPTIEWSRKGKALLPMGEEKFMGVKMTITSIQFHHRGFYRCEAFNTIGMIQRNIEVKVKFKPIVNAIRKVVRQAEGYVIELQCLVEANPDPGESELVWYKGATTISQSSGRFEVKVIRGAFNRLTYELKFNGVTQEDYGAYRCQATNDLGFSSDQVVLEQTSAPQRSVKLGIIIRGSATAASSCVFTLLLALAVCLFQYL